MSWLQHPKYRKNIDFLKNSLNFKKNKKFGRENPQKYNIFLVRNKISFFLKFYKIQSRVM